MSPHTYSAAQPATATTTTTDRIGPAQHDAAISATCLRAHHPYIQTKASRKLHWLLHHAVLVIFALSVVVVVAVACCCCIRLVLMLALTCAPCVLTFAPCTCVVFSLFQLAQHSTCTSGGCHQLQLALVLLFHSATSAASPLAHVVVSPSATGAGGAISIYIYNWECFLLVHGKRQNYSTDWRQMLRNYYNLWIMPCT